MNSSESLKYHKKYGGKLEINSKMPLETKQDLALAYTPGVAEVCKAIANDKDKSKIFTMKKNSVAIVTDGSAVLGLGNLGAEAALPVMEGKAILFKHFGNVDAFPICLETQEAEEIIKIVKNIAPAFGGINLEDIAAPKCFEILKRLQEELPIPVIHDDEQGTAVVVLAALINAIKVRGSVKEDIRIAINGAGAAGIAVARLLLKFGFKKLILCDSKGGIYEGRPGLTEEKERLAKLTNKACQIGLHEPGCVAGDISCSNGADVFIGVSVGGILKKEMVEQMASLPIIFALANPVPEIMPDEAMEGGAFIVATGRSDFPNQVNNLLAFPGIFRGALDNKLRKITDEMLIKAAENLAGLVEKPDREMILPDVFDKRIVKAVSEAIREE
jgi:malate dehydrogenase (oxaloacetate-decarboxylating)